MWPNLLAHPVYICIYVYMYMYIYIYTCVCVCVAACVCHVGSAVLCVSVCARVQPMELLLMLLLPLLHVVSQQPAAACGMGDSDRDQTDIDRISPPKKKRRLPIPVPKRPTATSGEPTAATGGETTAAAGGETTAAIFARWDSDDPTQWSLDRDGNPCHLGFLFRPASFRPDLAQWRKLPGHREHWYLPDGTLKPLWMLKRDAASFIRFNEEVRTACMDGDADGNVLGRLEEMARQVEEMQVARGESPTPGGVTLHQAWSILAASGGSAGGETPAAAGAETPATASSEPASVAGESAGGGRAGGGRAGEATAAARDPPPTHLLQLVRPWLAPRPTLVVRLVGETAEQRWRTGQEASRQQSFVCPHIAPKATPLVRWRPPAQARTSVSFIGGRSWDRRPRP